MSKGKKGNVLNGASLLTDHDIYLFKEGRHFRLYEKMGAHLMTHEGDEGAHFAVWAPNASRVTVMGDFNDWNPSTHELFSRPDGSGIWEGFVPGIKPGIGYKYHIESSVDGYMADKTDPFGVRTEVPPNTASILWELSYDWLDHDWMADREGKNGLDSPMSIYEMHLGSWRRAPGENGGTFLTYKDIAGFLVEHMKRTGFTHVEFLPVMEHPFYGSWGYQVTSYFAPTARYGPPEELMYLIDLLHQNGIGVILDWVPSHFPTDAGGLIYFDGTHLYEHADPRQGHQPDWDSAIFNYGRHEVRSFLISSAMYWLDRYHADGLRVDAVASMLYLDYSRKEDEWIPNRYGSNENLDAIEFIRSMNVSLYQDFPHTQTMAEESTAWPMVSKPTYLGGLGFGMKWDMGWMHDTLAYISQDPIHRKYHHNQLTFSIMYTFSENFVLPLSHDEVVHGKGALIGKMPGDEWKRFANLRLLYGYMWSHPGKKLLFMGGEFGQTNEWYHETSLDWHLLEHDPHRGMLRWMEDLNRFYAATPPLYENDFHPDGFRWIDCNDSDSSVISFLRIGKDPNDMILAVLNFTPLPRANYRIGVPGPGFWREVLNSDADEYWGSGWGNFGGLETSPVPSHGYYYSISLNAPPLGAVFFRMESPGTGADSAKQPEGETAGPEK